MGMAWAWVCKDTYRKRMRVIHLRGAPTARGCAIDTWMSAAQHVTTKDLGYMYVRGSLEASQVGGGH
jgi:hypothetical protein